MPDEAVSETISGPFHRLTRASVLAAMDEADELGRDAFLSKYGFGRARSYFVVRDGARYDSKAIYGVAYGIEHPDEGAAVA